LGYGGGTDITGGGGGGKGSVKRRVKVHLNAGRGKNSIGDVRELYLRGIDDRKESGEKARERVC